MESAPEVREGLFSFRGKKIPQCLIGVLLRIAVMWWIWLSVYLYSIYLSLAIKLPFRGNTTGQVGTDQATVASNNIMNALMGTC